MGFSQGGALEAYRGFSINAFDHFSRPFEHFRSDGHQRYSKPKWKDGQVVESSKQNCAGRDVSKCVVDFYKQDGHHELSNFTRMLLVEHPNWRSALGHTGNLNLFV